MKTFTFIGRNVTTERQYYLCNDLIYCFDEWRSSLGYQLVSHADRLRSFYRDWGFDETEKTYGNAIANWLVREQSTRAVKELAKNANRLAHKANSKTAKYPTL